MAAWQHQHHLHGPHGGRGLDREVPGHLPATPVQTKSNLLHLARRPHLARGEFRSLSRVSSCATQLH